MSLGALGLCVASAIGLSTSLRGARRLDPVPKGCTLSANDYTTCLSSGGCCIPAGCATGETCDFSALGVHAGPDASVEVQTPSGVDDGTVNVHTITEETPFGETNPEFGNAVGAIAPERFSNRVQASSWAQLFETPRAGATWVHKFKQITHTPPPTPMQNFWGSAMMDPTPQKDEAGLDDQVKFDPNEARDFSPTRNEFWVHQASTRAPAPSPAPTTMWSDVHAEQGYNVLDHEDQEENRVVRHPFNDFTDTDEVSDQKKKKTKKTSSRHAMKKKQVFDKSSFYSLQNELRAGDTHDLGLDASAQARTKHIKTPHPEGKIDRQWNQADMLASMTSGAGLAAAFKNAHTR